MDIKDKQLRVISTNGISSVGILTDELNKNKSEAIEIILKTNGFVLFSFDEDNSGSCKIALREMMLNPALDLTIRVGEIIIEGMNIVERQRQKVQEDNGAE